LAETEQVVRGIDVAPVSSWLEANVRGARAPLHFELVTAGGSCLTYRVVDAGGEACILRRPPVGARVGNAHDVAREWKILAALAHADCGVPVPPPLAFCEDDAITGAPFYAMAFAEGTILRTPAEAVGWSPAQCAAATDALVDVQVALHAVDVDAIGLGDLARTRTNYVERQLARWRRQIEAADTRDVPLLFELHGRLARHVPKEIDPGRIAHGDYRFDNVVLAEDLSLAAVLDWELCTLGDPVADFCWSLLYWADPSDSISALTDPPTLAPGFARRDEVAELYAQRSGRSLDAYDYYMAFSWWKQACIVEGVLARARQGSSGGGGIGSLDAIAERVDSYLQLADELASRFR
jgi:aminoglycoside phosphotransferase (APT) family kinase protein